MRPCPALRNTALVILSVLVALGLAEVVVRLFVPVRDVGPAFSQYDPILGKRLKANFAAVRITPEFVMRVSTNSYGFRGAEPNGQPAPSILFLGDSFTFGYGVSDGEEYPALVAAQLRQQYSTSAPLVLNAGVGNSGNGYWVKLLRSEAEKFAPRLVIMQLFENDFDDNVNERLFERDGHGGMIELPVPQPAPMRRLQALVEAVPGFSYSHLVGLIRQVPLALSDMQAARQNESSPPPEHIAETDRLTLLIIDEAMSICALHGWKVLALTVGMSGARDAAVTETFARHGASVLHIPSKLERPDLYYKIDGHWNSRGHAFVADQLLTALRAGLLDH
jgi:hypothetical protein